MADPTSVPGLLRRWRADSITGVADGGAVATWPALAGGVDWTQGAAGSRPTYAANALNGQPGVRFDGTADFMQATVTARAQPYTAVIVAKPTNVSSQRQLIAGNAGGLQVVIQSSGVPQAYAGTALNWSAVLTAAPHVIIAGFSGASSFITVDGATRVTGNAGTSGAGTANYLGRHDTASRYLAGDYFEFLLYDHVLTLAEQAEVDSYIQDRYGIAVADYVSSGPVVVQASSSGAGTLVATSAPRLQAAAAFTSDGTASAAATPRVTLPTAAAGSGSLAADTIALGQQSVSLSGEGSLIAATSTAQSTAAPAAGLGTLTAVTAAQLSAAAELAAAGQLSAAVEQIVPDEHDDHVYVTATIAPHRGAAALAGSGVGVAVLVAARAGVAVLPPATGTATLTPQGTADAALVADGISRATLAAQGVGAATLQTTD